MNRNRLKKLGFTGPLLAVVALGTLAPAWGDVVILKDGFTLHGKVFKEMTAFVDPNTEAVIPTAKANGLTICDDGVRMQVFPTSSRQVGAVENDFDRFARMEKFTRQIAFPFPPGPLAGSLKLRKASDFDKDWTRMLIFDDQQSGGYREVRQKVTVLSPHYMRMDSNTHAWACCYLTREWSDATVRKLLLAHPNMVPKDGKLDLEQWSKLIRFFSQEEHFLQAEDELSLARKELPGEKAKLDALAEEVEQERADKILQEIERARESGRHAFARQQLRYFSGRKTNTAKQTQILTTLGAEYEASQKRLETAREQLVAVSNSLAATAPGWLKDAADTIRGELHLDTAAKLDLFVTLADEVAVAVKAGRTAPHSPPELVAVAVSGWLIGKTAANKDISAAGKLWRTRQLVLEYQQIPLEANRRIKLVEYRKAEELPAYDEIDRMLPNLPPPLAAKDVSTKLTQAEPIAIPGTDGKLAYWLQLPPEYTHTRSYPLVIALPNGVTEKGEELAKSLSEMAARYGCILAVPNWAKDLHVEYTYSPEEHLLVTGLLWHLKRTHQVDSDRVILLGGFHGANMALDVAASHPDLFAGVVAISPFPKWTIFGEYWRNFQQLPVYLVFGDRAGDANQTLRGMLEKWMPKGYPAFAVSYKGRGAEGFGQELPYIFDWISRKKRSTGTPTLGHFDYGSSGEEYRTVRVTDDHFYWLKATSIVKRKLPPDSRAPEYWAKMTGKITEGNHITLKTQGVKEIVICLGRGMVDFDQKVEVFVNGATGTKYPVKPRAEVLLEDLYERADRQRPWFDKITISLK